MVAFNTSFYSEKLPFRKHDFRLERYIGFYDEDNELYIV